jgi:hypothetical protein
MLVGLRQILPGLSDIAIAFEKFIADDVYFLTLLKGQFVGLLHDAVHVHQTFGDVVDLSTPFLHYFVLQCEVNPHFLILLLLLLLYVLSSLSHRFMLFLHMSTPAIIPYPTPLLPAY